MLQSWQAQLAHSLSTTRAVWSGWPFVASRLSGTWQRIGRAQHLPELKGMALPSGEF